jgi:aryl-alcohol dehydrogenase-like predicted oxidoreductase
MENRTLGKSDLMVSRLALGTMTFGSQVDEQTAASMVDASLDHGVNFIDTANVYNAGESETILGRILRGKRDKVVLATKVGLNMGEGKYDKGLSAAAITKGIEHSLRRLQTDYVDLYYLHQPDYSVPLDESLQALQRLVDAGKVRQLGASNYASWQICQMLWMAQSNGWRPIRVVQPMYNVIARGIEQELLPCCKEFGLATVAYNPLAGGLLTGKQAAATPLAGSRFDRMPAYRDRYWHAANFEAVQDLAAAARVEKRSPTSLALSWLLHHSGVDCVLIGASRMEHIEENLEAARLPALSPETLAVCERVWSQVRGVQPQYNR